MGGGKGSVRAMDSKTAGNLAGAQADKAPPVSNADIHAKGKKIHPKYRIVEIRRSAEILIFDPKHFDPKFFDPELMNRVRQMLLEHKKVPVPQPNGDELQLPNGTVTELILLDS